MKHIYLFGLLIVAILVSCRGDSADGASFNRSFVQVFVLAEELDIHGGNGNIGIKFNGQEINHILNAHKDEYDRLCEKFGDMKYNRKNVPLSEWAIGDVFRTVNITSDKDFDDSHPAGSSLADIAVLNAKTAYPYILSGYKLTPRWTNNSKKISELTADDLTLFDPFVTVEFTVRPPEPDHTLTVTFSGPEKTISQKLEAKFL